MPIKRDGQLIKTFEEVQAEQAASRERLAQAAQASKERMDYFAQLEQKQAKERAEREHEHNLFAQRVEAWRANPTPIDRSTLPTMEDYYRQKTMEDQAAEQAAEAARIAALSRHDVWLSTLPYSEQQKVRTWEGINHMPYPVPGLE